ncbi:peptidase family C50-domain-containing protein [Blyttiomyces helicus]|uniref:separase n=1 Tax=Blyttiomyces helicus TaxID=388810 RepID=A0A4P9WGX2_9FUNG|nr:peptidase family C50-domain-containing protein [Blyttiomyces helicus]|eukprot:RKO91964.1 peptidase family C50-domain-containing protein [Blyttiomyces helicus]
MLPSTPTETATLLHSHYSAEPLSTPATFQRDAIDSLPDHIVAVSLSVDREAGDMYVTRLACGVVPVVMRLPLKRQALREGEEDGLGLDEALEELRDVVERGAGMARGGDACKTREERVQWWKERKELDERLRALLGKVETVWLGGFKGLLITDDYNEEILAVSLAKFKETIERLIFKAVAKKTRSTSPRAVELLPLDTEVCRVFLRLGAKPTDDREVEDALYYLMDAYQYSGVGVDYDEIDIDSMTFAFKDALEAFHSDRSKLLELRPPSPALPTTPMHIVLIPDKHLQALPWESIPILRGRPVSRLPSLCFLRDRLLLAGGRERTVDPANVGYVLNPGQDLGNTEKEFEDVVARQGWTGITARAPSESEFSDALTNKDIFLYFGHGGGEQFIRGHRVRQLERCAVTLLMGCSSGTLRPSGEFDPYGTALNYIMAGCPALVANLWDVTDRDIDRFSHRLFRLWGLCPPEDGESCAPQTGCDDGAGPSLVQAVAEAREACTLKFLIGAAPVVYGVPVYLAKGP